ncbi:MAG TPA: hypothetical protein VM681_08385 [Candidatus Thermoplasmatota archaeon]|nr:hypothetical protein [Candidatus Thermoplasmatota archaeon]
MAALSATVLLAPAAEAGSITLCGSGGCSTHYRGTLPIGDHCVNTTGSGDPCGGSAPAVK